MKLQELPQEIQDKLVADRNGWKGHITSGAYGVAAYNQNGTRFFEATRNCVGWQDTKTGNSMPFGGGTYWVIRYGEVRWRRSVRRDPLGNRYTEYEWVNSNTYCRTTNNITGEIVEIPHTVGTKKEVMAILKKLEFMGFKDLRTDKFYAPKTITVYDEIH